MIPFDVVGIGPGSRDYLLPVALRAIENADLLAGSPRLLDYFSDLGKEVFPYRSNLSALLEYIAEEQGKRKIAVLVSGDPGYHSLLGAVSRRFPEDAYNVIPGISSFQTAMARRKKPWQNDLLLSCHGKDFGEISEGAGKALAEGRRVVLLTDHRWNPGAVAAELLESLKSEGSGTFRAGALQAGKHRVWLAEDLTMAEENFEETSLEKLAAGEAASAGALGTGGAAEKAATAGSAARKGKKEYRLCVMIIE